MTQSISRRSLLASAAAIPAASALPAWATAPMLGASTPLYNRFTLGGFEVTTLLAGSATRDNPQSIFGMNVSPEEFAAVEVDQLVRTVWKGKDRPATEKEFLFLFQVDAGFFSYGIGGV